MVFPYQWSNGLWSAAIPMLLYSPTLNTRTRYVIEHDWRSKIRLETRRIYERYQSKEGYPDIPPLKAFRVRFSNLGVCSRISLLPRRKTSSLLHIHLLPHCPSCDAILIFSGFYLRLFSSVGLLFTELWDRRLAFLLLPLHDNTSGRNACFSLLRHLYLLSL